MVRTANKKRDTRKYNRQTGFYKIDVFLDNKYLWSSDWHETCKSAKESACKQKPDIDPKRITAFFDRS